MIRRRGSPRDVMPVGRSENFRAIRHNGRGGSFGIKPVDSFTRITAVFFGAFVKVVPAHRGGAREPLIGAVLNRVRSSPDHITCRSLKKPAERAVWRVQHWRPPDGLALAHLSPLAVLPLRCSGTIPRPDGFCSPSRSDCQPPAMEPRRPSSAVRSPFAPGKPLSD
jgi:hypothetical protein